MLRRVAHVVESCLRGTDLAARYGGEEFAAVLIDTDLTGALDVAERIRLGVRALREDTNGETITMSIGVAACPADATSREQLVDKADWATDLAKRRGRDQVVAFADQRKARRAARQGDYASAMARFAAFIRRAAPDVVHGHGSKGGLYARLSAITNPTAALRAGRL